MVFPHGMIKNQYVPLHTSASRFSQCSFADCMTSGTRGSWTSTTSWSMLIMVLRGMLISVLTSWLALLGIPNQVFLEARSRSFRPVRRSSLLFPPGLPGSFLLRSGWPSDVAVLKMVRELLHDRIYPPDAALWWRTWRGRCQLLAHVFETGGRGFAEVRRLRLV